MERNYASALNGDTALGVELANTLDDHREIGTHDQRHVAFGSVMSSSPPREPSVSPDSGTFQAFRAYGDDRHGFFAAALIYSPPSVGSIERRPYHDAPGARRLAG